MLDAAKPIVIAVILSFLTESMTEFLFGQAFKNIPKLTPLSWTLQYVAAGTGVTLAMFYQIDLIALTTNDLPTVIGMILTGLTIGRGSNYLHQFVGRYFPAIKPVEPAPKDFPIWRQ